MRKIITMTGGSRQARDIDRLYVERKKGGRGLMSIEDMYEIRMVGLMEHLEQMKEKHSLFSDSSINCIRFLFRSTSVVRVILSIRPLKMLIVKLL